MNKTFNKPFQSKSPEVSIKKNINILNKNNPEPPRLLINNKVIEREDDNNLFSNKILTMRIGIKMTNKIDYSSGMDIPIVRTNQNSIKKFTSQNKLNYKQGQLFSHDVKGLNLNSMSKFFSKPILSNSLSKPKLKLNYTGSIIYNENNEIKEKCTNNLSKTYLTYLSNSSEMISKINTQNKFFRSKSTLVLSNISNLNNCLNNKMNNKNNNQKASRDYFSIISKHLYQTNSHKSILTLINKSASKDNNLNIFPSLKTKSKAFTSSNKKNVYKSVLIRNPLEELEKSELINKRTSMSSMRGSNVSEAMSRRLSMEIENNPSLKKETAMPNLKSSHSVNNYLIRNFNVGDHSEIQINSKKKLKLTTDFLKLKQKNGMKRIKQLSERINGINKKDGLRSNDDESLDSDEMITIEVKKKKELDPILRIEKNKNDYRRLSQNLNDLKVKHEQKVIEEIKLKSLKLVDLILENHCGEYEEIPQDEKAHRSKNLYLTNINRVIRLRKILKTKHDPYDDIPGLMKNNESDSETEHKTAKEIYKLGAPCYIKNKFKKTTIEKYKIANGNYFG